MAVKLHYFNITGLGEPIRWILKYGGIEFEDIRYEFEEWPEVKKSEKNCWSFMKFSKIL